ncbi:MAG: beta-galactosidase family protein [Terracidiphilus sp.]
MKILTIAAVCAVLAIVFTAGAAYAQDPAAHTAHVLRANGDHFELDGKPFQIISGAIHYARVPRAYWRDRLRKARAMGLNTVETYVFWNFHETSPGVYDFSGEKDVAEFIREAQQEGLFVILRPGPYVCAEWDFGGLPPWLLREPGMVVRSSNPAFMADATRWMHRLGQELAPLQSAYGGPIIAVQVENEYVSFGTDSAYMHGVKQMLLDSGFDKAMLYTADGPEQVNRSLLPELPAAINFGGLFTSSEKAFGELAKERPHGPKMNGEFWDGWFDHWGEKHHTTSAAGDVANYKWMLDKGYSVNLYMFHGGTSFGWMNGANIDQGKYGPTVTSYDYDVPVSESGELKPKFYLFRDAIREVTGKTPPAPPEPLPVKAFAPVKLESAVSIWDTLPKPVESKEILSMEDVGQSYGYILYRTTIGTAQSADLHIEELHSYAQVYLDGVLAGTLDRRLDQSTLPIHATHDNTRLDILVENSGRVNFGHSFPNERAGITHRVTLGDAVLTGWKIYPLPIDKVSSYRYKQHPCSGACFYQASFDVDEPADTFVDARELSKGVVWINGQPLGRFWSIGPQRTLYLPAPWLKKGRNEIVVFDLSGQTGRTVPFLAKAILDGN